MEVSPSSAGTSTWQETSGVLVATRTEMTLDGDPGHSLPQPLISLTGSGYLTRQYLDSEADLDISVRSLDIRVTEDVSTWVGSLPCSKNRSRRTLLVSRQSSAEHLATLGAPPDRPRQLLFPAARHSHLATRPVHRQFGETARVAGLW